MESSKASGEGIPTSVKRVDSRKLCGMGIKGRLTKIGSPYEKSWQPAAAKWNEEAAHVGEGPSTNYQSPRA